MGWQRKGAKILPQTESVFPVKILEGICPCYLWKYWQCKKKKIYFYHHQLQGI